MRITSTLRPAPISSATTAVPFGGLNARGSAARILCSASRSCGAKVAPLRPHTARKLRVLVQAFVNNNAPAPPPATDTATPGSTILSFRVPHYAAKNGQKLYIVGSIAELGGWQYSAGVRLAQDWNDSWTAEVVLPPAARGAVEYKLVAVDGSNTVTWEPGNNRKLQINGPSEPSSASFISTSLSWGQSEEVNITRVAAQEAPPVAAPEPIAEQPLADEKAAAPTSTKVVRCRLSVHMPGPLPGRSVVIAGSVPQLGGWDLSQGVVLKEGGAHVWSAEVQLPVGADTHAKVVTVDGAGNAQWEGGDNRDLTLGDITRASTPGTSHVILHAGCPATKQVLFEPQGLTTAGAPGSAAPELEATALITVPNRAPGETLILTGSIPALGNWDPAAGLKLEGAGNIVEGKIKLLAGTVAEAKLVVVDAQGRMHWEAGANRVIDWASASKSISPAATAATCVTTVYWNNPGLVQHVVVPTASLDTQAPTPQLQAIATAEPASDSVSSVASKTAPEPGSTPAATAEDAVASEEALAPVAKQGSSELNIGEGIQQAVMPLQSMWKSLFGAKKEEEQKASSPSAQPTEPEIGMAAITQPQEGVPVVETPASFLNGTGKHQPVEAAAAEPAPAATTEVKSVGARPRTAGRAPSPRRTSPAPAVPRVGGVQPPEDMAAHESQVLATLATYPGISLDRLQDILVNSTMLPKYERTPERLSTLLSYLKSQGNITEEGGVYTLKSVELPRARRRSPSARASSKNPSPPPAPAAAAPKPEDVPAEASTPAAANTTASGEVAAPAAEKAKRGRRATPKSPAPAAEDTEAPAAPAPARRRRTPSASSSNKAAEGPEAGPITGVAEAAAADAQAIIAAAPAPAEGAAADAPVPAGMEVHVVALVESHGSLSVERLHTLLKASAPSTRYEGTVKALSTFMAELEAAGKVVEEKGLYRLKGTDGIAAPTSRRSTPRPSRSRKSAPPGATGAGTGFGGDSQSSSGKGKKGSRDAPFF